VFIAVRVMPSHISCVTSKRISATWKLEIKLIYWLIPTTDFQVSSLRIIIFSSSLAHFFKIKISVVAPKDNFPAVSTENNISLVSLMNGSLLPFSVNAVDEFGFNRN
jgi:hypothetical protein